MLFGREMSQNGGPDEEPINGASQSTSVGTCTSLNSGIFRRVKSKGCTILDRCVDREPMLPTDCHYRLLSNWPFGKLSWLNDLLYRWRVSEDPRCNPSSLLLSADTSVIENLAIDSGTDDEMSIDAKRILRLKKLEREKLQKLGNLSKKSVESVLQSGQVQH